MIPYIKRISEDWIETHSSDELVGSWRDPLLLIEVVIECNKSWSWMIISSIIDLDIKRTSLRDLVHGPLESWVSRYAVNSIELIEEQARNSEQFRWALGGLVETSGASSVWERIESVRGEPWPESRL